MDEQMKELENTNICETNDFLKFRDRCKSENYKYKEYFTIDKNINFKNYSSYNKLVNKCNIILNENMECLLTKTWIFSHLVMDTNPADANQPVWIYNKKIDKYIYSNIEKFSRPTYSSKYNNLYMVISNINEGKVIIIKQPYNKESLHVHKDCDKNNIYQHWEIRTENPGEVKCDKGNNNKKSKIIVVMLTNSCCGKGCQSTIHILNKEHNLVNNKPIEGESKCIRSIVFCTRIETQKNHQFPYISSKEGVNESCLRGYLLAGAKIIEFFNY
ncbi:hypothetical protein H8356DRAFT_1416982 [Neocallimastix lanati (nom. inval.)]|nr:hypothetical protein H8356DRAFT_1416982 [Neocallimastix sp. JGI-2020a]